MTGVVTTGVHILIASLWINFVQPLPSVANGVAFLGATLVSLLVNTYWSFSTKLSVNVMSRYSVVTFIGLSGSMMLAHLADMAGASYWIGILTVVLVMPVVNFLLHHYWTYKI